VVTSIITPEGKGQWLETPGGYSDYVSQKKSGGVAFRSSALETASKGGSKAGDKAASTAATAKLTYKDQHRLTELNRLMPERQKEIVDLEDAMADSALFTKDPKGFQTRANRLTAARAELEGYEEEWLALEEKREALGRS